MGATTPNIQGAVSPYILGATSPYILGAKSPDNLNIIEVPNPSSSPFGGTSSSIIPVSELHEGHEVGGTSVSLPTPPEVVLIFAIPQVPQVGGTSILSPNYSRLAKIETNSYCNAGQTCTRRILRRSVSTSQGHLHRVLALASSPFPRVTDRT